MNWMDDETLHVPYPKWTFTWKGMRNPLSGKTEETVMDATRTRECIQKYRDRGWLIANDSDAATHTCRTDPYCPHAQRSTHDSATFVLRFKKCRRTPNKAARAYVTWRMGGSECKGAGVRSSSCVATCNCIL